MCATRQMCSNRCSVKSRRENIRLTPASAQSQLGRDLGVGYPLRLQQALQRFDETDGLHRGRVVVFAGSVAVGGAIIPPGPWNLMPGGRSAYDASPGRPKTRIAPLRGQRSGGSRKRGDQWLTATSRRRRVILRRRYSESVMRTPVLAACARAAPADRMPSRWPRSAPAA